MNRTLITLGAPGDGPGSGDDLLELPKGASGRALQDALRAHPDLAACEVYVTKVDDLAYRLRVFGDRNLLLTRSVRPWLPERPVVSGADPPEIGVIFLFGDDRDDATLRRVTRWESPLAVGLPPFAAHAVGSAREAAWASKEAVVVLREADDVEGQLAAMADARVALLTVDPPAEDPAAWLEPLADRDVALIDARDADPTELAAAAATAGVRYLRRAGHLGAERGPVVARNLAVRRGYGIVTVDASAEGVAAAEAFIEQARDEGYALVFPVEVARLHGGR